MAKKSQEVNPAEQLQERFDHWDDLYKNGGCDPSYSDGGNLNMVRNQIVCRKQDIEKAYPSGDYPEIYHRETPPEVDRDYMANADEIRVSAKNSLAAYRQDENFCLIQAQAPSLNAKTAKQLCVAAILGYATHLECAIAADELIYMRIHKNPKRYLESFEQCANQIRAAQLTPIVSAEAAKSAPLFPKIREEKEYPNMEKATLQVEFSQEKLEALTFYMAEKGLTIEGELQEYVNTLYEKNIPAATRKYLDRNDAPGEQQSEKPEVTAKTVQSEEERLAFNNARREKRKAEKEQKQSDSPVPAAGLAPEDAPAEEESQGMTMSM